MWRGKVIAQMVESTLIMWEDLGLSPMYANIMLLFYYWFLIICMGMELALWVFHDWNVSLTWIGWIGYALEGWLNGHGFKLGWEGNWNFIFYNVVLEGMWEYNRKSRRGSQEGLENIL